MLGTIRFQHDSVNDIHFAHPKWLIETEADCRVWHAQFTAYFSRFAEKVDVIVVLDDFRLGPGIGSIWGRYRSDWIRRYTRYSVRVHADARVSTFNATSSAIHGGGHEEAPDIPSAVARILDLRRAEATK